MTTRSAISVVGHRSLSYAPTLAPSHIARCSVTGVCVLREGLFWIVPPPMRETSLYTKNLRIHSACRGPLRQKVVKNDICSQLSHVRNTDVESFPAPLALAAQHIHSLGSVPPPSLQLACQICQLCRARLHATLIDSFGVFFSLFCHQHCHLMLRLALVWRWLNSILGQPRSMFARFPDCCFFSISFETRST